MNKPNFFRLVLPKIFPNLLAVTSFKATNSVFKITDENNSFLITTLGHWNSKSAQKIINDMNKLLELRSQNDIELHVE